MDDRKRAFRIFRGRSSAVLVLATACCSQAWAAAICGERIFGQGFDTATAPADCLTSSAFFDDTQVREIRLVFPDPNWYQTLYDAHANDTSDPAFPASFDTIGVFNAKRGERMKRFKTNESPGKN